MERSQLEAILNDAASTPQEKAAAQAALDSHADLIPLHDDTRAMLAALKVERIQDLNEEIYERHCVAHFVKPSDPLVKEFRNWIQPDDRTLWLLTGQDRNGGLRWYWQTVLDTYGERQDVKAHALRKLRGLEE